MFAVARRLERLLVLCFACAGCTCAPDLHATRTHLATVPADFDPRLFVMSDDGGSYAYVTRRDGLFHVVHDGKMGPPFLEVSAPRMAPATRQIFYWGVEDGGGRPKVTLIADDKLIGTSLDRPGEIAFSARGRRWAAVGGTAKRDGGEIARGPVVVYRDGRELGTYADATVPALSREGDHVAVLVERADGRIALAVDGNEERDFAPPTVSVSPLVRPNQIGPSLAGMRIDYLADGTLLYLTRDEGGWALYRGEKRVASFKVNISRSQGLLALDGGLQYAGAIAGDLIGFAESAPVAAWWERLEGERPRWRVVRDGVPVDDVVCAKPWEHEPPVLSADGSHVAYACPRFTAEAIEEVIVVFDGRQFGPYVGVWGLTLSPDNRRVAYAADDDAPGRPWRYVVDGVPRPTRYDRVWPPRFSPDGRLLFWVAQHGDRVVLMVNGAGRASSDAVVWVPKIGENGNLWWITQRGQRLSRLVLK